MKEIGIVERDYHIIKKGKKFDVEFRINGHSVSIENFKPHEDMSEETLCFSGALVIDGNVVGTCKNNGCGGCAMYYLDRNFEEVNEIYKNIAELENYCFPKMKLNLYDVIDAIANFLVVFIDVTTISKTKTIINQLNKSAEIYRQKYS
jgi:hypothetical protein